MMESQRILRLMRFTILISLLLAIVQFSMNTYLSHLLRIITKDGISGVVHWSAATRASGLQQNSSQSVSVIVLAQRNRFNWSNETAVLSTPGKQREPLPLCPLQPPGLIGPITVDMHPYNESELAGRHQHIQNGGIYRPSNCTARHRVAILVPYRNRHPHLMVLLNHLHKVLPRQQIDYVILVVELALPTRFNRALLMNIGFLEATRLFDIQCCIFHDVDMYVENDRCLYTCPEKDTPRHLASEMDKFNYGIPYNAYFGAVSAMTTEQVKKVNGFSNLYFGWGGEDDDMYTRITHRGMRLTRYPKAIGRYRMMKHGGDATNKINPMRFELLKGTKARMDTEGLSSTLYQVEKYEQRPMYTYLLVSVNETMYTMNKHGPK